MRYFSLIIAIFCLAGCSCSNGPIGGVIRVGIDRDWYPLDFGSETAYVNGFTEDLLIEMSNYSGLEFEVLHANWSNLEMGLKQNHYDAILTSMPPYEFNRAKYAFSSNFLDIGPVLIVPSGSSATKLSSFSNQMVGILRNDPAALVLEKHPKIIIRQYPSIPALLNSLTKGEINAAMLDKIPAEQYVDDLYRGVLQIVSDPMTDAGLHMVGKPSAVEAFDKSLKSLQRKNTLKTLKKKWELSN